METLCIDAIAVSHILKLEKRELLTREQHTHGKLIAVLAIKNSKVPKHCRTIVTEAAPRHAKKTINVVMVKGVQQNKILRKGM